MRAWQVHELGDPWEVLKLEEVEEPEPGPGEVVVEVEAAALNFFDTLLCRGEYQERPELPFIPGGEATGTIVAVGEDVDLEEGLRVIATPFPSGSYAERSPSLPRAASSPFPTTCLPKLPLPCT
jgi:NADPH2:quinone reductase